LEIGDREKPENSELKANIGDRKEDAEDSRHKSEKN
jgi:hypothetical protein